jgi:saccharopine dehydrogenase-like NADP-dependent oxidoreductase
MHMRFIVLGTGLMGRAVVYDLAKSLPGVRLVVADRDLGRARRVAREFGLGSSAAKRVDVRDAEEVARLLRGSFAVINCTQYDWNLEVMRAALAARVHYLDLGGLYYVTRKQFHLDRAFRRAGRLALVGMGGAPGITNVMARHLVDRLDRLDSLRVYNASADLQRYATPVAATFSLSTILDELTKRPVTFAAGRFGTRPLLSDPEAVRFRPPIGPVVLRHSLHSELGTLPFSFRGKGVREVCFKINYDSALVNAVQTLATLGLLEAEPIPVDGVKVSPRATLQAVLARRAPRKPPRDVEALRVIAVGRREGKRIGLAMEAWARYTVRPAFSAVARDTGFPASIAAQMLARGEIRGVGVRPPEDVVPPAPFFRELERRNIRLRRWKQRVA